MRLVSFVSLLKKQLFTYSSIVSFVTRASWFFIFGLGASSRDFRSTEHLIKHLFEWPLKLKPNLHSGLLMLVLFNVIWTTRNQIRTRTKFLSNQSMMKQIQFRIQHHQQSLLPAQNDSPSQVLQPFKARAHYPSTLYCYVDGTHCAAENLGAWAYLVYLSPRALFWRLWYRSN